MRGFLFGITIMLAFVAGGTFYGHFFQRAGFALAAETVGDIPLEKLRELAEVFSLIRENYVEEVPSEQLMEQALRGMVEALDPHSAYLDADDLGGFQESINNKEYGGVGMHVGERDGWIEVVSPIYGTPASRAGLASGDIILKIEGVSTQGMAVGDGVDKMRGEVGTDLQLEILPADGGDVRTVVLTRENVVVPSVVSSLVKGEGGGDYGYVRVTRFQSKTLEDFAKNINGLYDEAGAPLKGIILDLRDNPGGYLDAGVGVAAAFLPAGATVVSDRGRTKDEKVFLANRAHHSQHDYADEILDVPMVVLVNSGSASASEIVAGALQDHKRGVLMGVRTYGKGSVQTIQPLQSSRGQTALRLTMARYYTPAGRSIQGVGVVPDVVVRHRREDEAAEEEDEGYTLREENLQGNLENDGEAADGEASGAGEAAVEEGDSRPPFIGDNDHQYDQALVVLRAMSIVAAR